MSRLKTRFRLGVLLVSGWLTAWTVAAQPGGELDVSEGGVPVTRLVSDPGMPYENVFRNQAILGGTKQPKVGPGGRLSFGLPGAAMSSGMQLPFVTRGFSPSDATLKLGRFYMDVGPLSGSVLWTDNKNRSSTDRQTGIISVARLEFQGLVQWNEGLQFAIRGAAIWLPFQNEAGLDGFGLFDPVNARFGAAGGRIPLRAQFVYDFVLSKWDMQFIDDFSADFTDGFFGIRGEFADELVVTDPIAFNEQDRAGRYRFGGTGASTTSRAGRTTQLDTAQQLDTRSLVLRNLVGLSATRSVPTNTRMTLFASHQDQWYFDNPIAMPAKIDTAGVIAVNERENMRFKPFASYRGRQINTRPGLDQIAEGGVFGPITDQLDFLGSAGWSKAGRSNQENLIWQINLNHTAGPYTTQTLSFSRQVSDPEPNSDLIEVLSYRITQILGPDLTGQIFARWITFDDLDNNLMNSKQWVIGARLLYRVSPRTDILAQVVRTQIEEDDPAVGDSIYWTGRLTMGHKFSESLTGRVAYSYENRDGGVVGNTYEENLVVLTIEKQFR